MLEKRLCSRITIDEAKFGFMPERRTLDAVFIFRMLQDEYHAKGRKLYMCLADLENAFGRVPRNMMGWAMRKKGVP